jgi:hypothetical protein
MKTLGILNVKILNVIILSVFAPADMAIMILLQESNVSGMFRKSLQKDRVERRLSSSAFYINVVIESKISLSF